jgi:hypothetical protein
MGKCNAIVQSGPNKGKEHGTSAGITRQHGGHTHIVCKTHDKDNVVFDCKKGEQLPLKAKIMVFCPVCKNWMSEKIFNVHVDEETGPNTVQRNKPRKMVAPLPETPKLGVHCHRLGCKETTDVRGFFCCGAHEDCKH